VDGLEIHDGGGAADVEQILPNAEVASATALLAADVCEPMFHGNSLTEAFTALWSCDELAQAVLQRLVVGDADGATRGGRRHRARGAQRAAPAHFGVELHDGARLEALDLGRIQLDIYAFGAEKDHIVPWDKGGETVMENLRCHRH